MIPVCLQTNMYNELFMCISTYVLDGYCVLLGSMIDS